MSTERELHPTFDPLEPVHNPVTQTPAPATEQPVVQYVVVDGKTYEEVIEAFLELVIKDATSNNLRSAAYAVRDHGKQAKMVPITKYHDEPKTEAQGSEPIERPEIEETPYEELAPGDKMNNEALEGIKSEDAKGEK